MSSATGTGGAAGGGGALLLENCSVLDVRAGATRPGQAVLCAGGRITAVGAAVEVARHEAAAGARRVDLGGACVAPGLVNCHVHFGLVLPGPMFERYRNESREARALRMAGNARSILRSGVTTVRLIGEERWADVAIRDSIARGETEGPRVLCSGPLILATGGHGHDLPGSVEADGPDGFRRAARETVRAGCDWVKIAISGGIAGSHEAIADAHITPEEMAAACDAAHRFGRKVAAHAGPPGAIRDAVHAGIDSIEHGYFLDEQTCTLMAERGVWLVPTVNVSRAVEFYARIGAPDWMVWKALEAGKLHWAALETAIRCGVPIAMGTDMMPDEPFEGTTVTMREIAFYAEAGMSNAAALRSATTRAAELLGLEREIGLVEEGMAADLIAVGGDPLADLAALRDLRLVVQAGRVVGA